MLALILCTCFLLSVNTQELLDAYKPIQYDFDGTETHTNHRVRRATEVFNENITYTCDTSNHPQPTAEYPAVLFENLNYNNCTPSGRFVRLRANDFIKWVENIPRPGRGRRLTWSSMLMIPGLNVTFRACCPSGNDFTKSVSNWKDTANMNLSVFHHPDLQGNNGIWYQRWLHWVMSFYIRIEPPTDLSVIPDCGNCYFGQCGLTDKCECAPGYSGTECDIRPTNDSYPTQEKPLVLFKEKRFQGSYIYGNPDEFKKFASNSRDVREVQYKSLRVLRNRTVTFARNIKFTSTWKQGSDIEDIANFMLANTDVADPLWYNFDPSIEVDFYVKVEGNIKCDNCSLSNGVCYTGSCVCKPGFTGAHCDISV